MNFISLSLIGIFGGNVLAAAQDDTNANLRGLSVDVVPLELEHNTEHLDLEIEVDGERQLFPLLPGTR